MAKEILRGVAQAQEDINDKWLECKKQNNCGKDTYWGLQVLIASDDNDPELSKNIATHLVENKYLVKSKYSDIYKDKKILAVIGHNSSQVSNKVIEKYQNKLLMLSPTSYTLNHAHDKIVAAGENNFIFSIVPPVETALTTIIDHIDNPGSVTKRNMVFCADPQAHDTDRLIAELDKEINTRKNKKIKLAGFQEQKDKRYEIACDIEKMDNEIFVAEKKNGEKLTDLFLSVHVNTIIDGIILARRHSHMSLYAVYTLFTRDAIVADLNGLVLAVNWHSRSHTDEKNENFIKQAECIWNGKDMKEVDCKGKFDRDIDLTWRSAMAYDATQVIMEGLKKISFDKENDVARQKLQQQISQMKLDGVTGKIEFEENGMRKGGKGYLVQLCEDKGKYKFMPLEKNHNGHYKKLDCHKKVQIENDSTPTS